MTEPESAYLLPPTDAPPQPVRTITVAFDSAGEATITLGPGVFPQQLLTAAALLSCMGNYLLTLYLGEIPPGNMKVGSA